ncbi:MAG: hypothetical protein NXI03_11730, partial [Alphaproteobacteria bacterium]|nr:hypothetical protein [Alphaproteobacteria bacterium]
DPALNPDIRIVHLDFRDGASVEKVMVALAAEFPTDEYPKLTFRDTPLFRDIVSEWMLENWDNMLHVELLFREQDCRDQIELLHDVAAAFTHSVESAQFERMRLEQYGGVAHAHGRFVLRMFVFE